MDQNQCKNLCKHYLVQRFSENVKFGSTPKKKEEGELSLNTVTKGDIEGAKLLIDNMYTQFCINGVTYQAKSLSDSNSDFDGGATVDFDFANLRLQLSGQSAFTTQSHKRNS